MAFSTQNSAALVKRPKHRAEMQDGKNFLVCYGAAALPDATVPQQFAHCWSFSDHHSDEREQEQVDGV